MRLGLIIAFRADLNAAIREVNKVSVFVCVNVYHRCAVLLDIRLLLPQRKMLFCGQKKNHIVTVALNKEQG